MKTLQKIKSRLHPLSRLSVRLMKYFLLVILLMFFLSVYSIESSSSLNRQNNNTLEHIQSLQLLLTRLEDTAAITSNYFTNPSDKYLSQFKTTYGDAAEYAASLRALYPESYLYRDISAMLDSYYEDAISLFDKFSLEVPTFKFNREKIALDNLRTGIYSYIYQGMSDELTLAQENIQSNHLVLKNNLRSTYLLIVIFTLICAFTAYKMSSSFALPIRNLSLKCAAVASGKRDLYLEKIKPDDEINILITSFNEMVNSLKISEQQLEEKYQIEQQLQEEQIKNAQMQTLLSLSELEYLLMQINPHFLYNTLNSISALTIIEDAPKSKEMIDSLSGLLRNSLSVLHDTVPLQVEIETIKNYLNIQKVRFGSRLGYQIDVPDDCLNETIPAMILQPLVENAIVHGLELKTDCGTLKIGACKHIGGLVLTVQDDGVGIDPRTLEKMQTPPDDGTYDFRSGIGIPNVKRRLFLLYNKDVLQIESTLGSGTFITITLPEL